jgi:ribonuclease J
LFLYFGKMSSFHLIDEFQNAAGPVNVIYSQWLGYLDGTHGDYFGSDSISAFRSDPEVNFVYAHTSGHASVADLQRLAGALNPRKLVPIHTEHGEDFSQLFANVVTLNDGEVFVLA